MMLIPDQRKRPNLAIEIARAKGYHLLQVGDEETLREYIRIFQVTGRNP